jgi:hypothetical protein
MKVILLFCALGWSLTATAQRLVATMPPITYHVGLQKAPLFLSYRDTLRQPSLYLPSQSEAIVVGQAGPRWAIAKREGFLYLIPTQLLNDYDPDDAAPLPLDPQTQRIAYQGVIMVPGVSQADLYTRAAAWINQTYTADKELVQNPTTGELVLKAARPVTVRREYEGVLRPSYAGVVRHTLTVYVKDGRYKYVFTDLTHDAMGTRNMQSGGPLEQPKANLFGYVGLGSQKPWLDMKHDATRDVRNLATSLQEAMTLQKVKKAGKDARDF